MTGSAFRGPTKYRIDMYLFYLNRRHRRPTSMLFKGLCGVGALHGTPVCSSRAVSNGRQAIDTMCQGGGGWRCWCRYADFLVFGVVQSMVVTCCIVLYQANPLSSTSCARHGLCRIAKVLLPRCLPLIQADRFRVGAQQPPHCRFPSAFLRIWGTHWVQPAQAHPERCHKGHHASVFSFGISVVRHWQLRVATTARQVAVRRTT